MDDLGYIVTGARKENKKTKIDNSIIFNWVNKVRDNIRIKNFRLRHGHVRSDSG